ncbi:hypothetical protein Cgig2_029674 [Carnegiea gigantea]|uniref:Uncharacterized protein n=1 Tax=Carnegiea gigantea TaxID=171969 RepID=A0A9Q1KJ31_9CARY|nr:hypothetical protein Cgig2_029674 [Carnegiea gigantea]
MSARDQEQEHGHTSEETDQLSRSTKKMKRGTGRSNNDIIDEEDTEMMEAMLGSSNVPDSAPIDPGRIREDRVLSYRDTLQLNNPNLTFETKENSVFMESDERGRQSNQRLSDNHGEGMETKSASTENHDSRFRGLANLDLNADLEANMESREILGYKVKKPVMEPMGSPTIQVRHETGVSAPARMDGTELLWELCILEAHEQFVTAEITAAGKRPWIFTAIYVTDSTANGGLGVRSMGELNSASMAKMAWRLLHEDDALWARVLKHRYGRGRTGVEMNYRNRLILQRGLVHFVGNGQHTYFWLQRWATEHPLLEFSTRPVLSLEQRKTVSNYWQPGRGWKWEELTDLLPTNILHRIAAFQV